VAFEVTGHSYFEAMKKGEYSSYEDVLLVQAINRHLGATGVIQWRKMRGLQGRDVKSMQNRWAVIKKKYRWNPIDNAWQLREVNREYTGTKTEKVQEYFSRFPHARPRDVCSELDVNHNTVYSVRRNMRQKGLIPTKGNATPIANVENTRKTPQNASTGVLPKRVVVKKSFLWGAFTFERYE
jgi:transposase-like protein